MIRSAVSFFILAIVAYALGSYQIAGLSLDIGKILLIVFLAFAAISLIFSLLMGKKQKISSKTFFTNQDEQKKRH